MYASKKKLGNERKGTRKRFTDWMQYSRRRMGEGGERTKDVEGGMGGRGEEKISPERQQRP